MNSSFPSRAKFDGGNTTPRMSQSPRQSPRQPRKKNNKRSSFVDSSDYRQGSSSSSSNHTAVLRKARSMNYIETMIDDSDNESVNSRYSEHGFSRAMRKKKVTFSNPLIIPSSCSTAMVVPFSNDDMDTYDNSFNDENIVAFNKVVPVKHLVKMREKKKSFDVIAPILKKTVQRTKNKPPHGKKDPERDSSSSSISQNCRCTIS